jgi:hypothetical protein
MSSGHVLAECDPKSIEVANNEFSHTIKRFVKAFHHLHSIFKPLIDLVDPVCVDVQIDLAAPLRTRLATRVEHDLAIAK